MIDAAMIGRAAAGMYLVGAVISAVWFTLTFSWTLATHPHDVPHYYRATLIGQLKVWLFLALCAALWPAAWVGVIWLARQGGRS